MNISLDIIQNKYDNDLPLNDEDFATLSFALGLFTQAQYSSTATVIDPFEVWDAFSIYLQYLSADIRSPINGFYEDLKNNMKNELPAEITIMGSGGFHAIVCDGYNSDDFYHFNFGWGENSPTSITDCWYKLPEGLPEEFSNIQNAVINIKPGVDEQTLLVATDTTLIFEPILPNRLTEVQECGLRNYSTNNIYIENISAPPNFYISLDGLNYSNNLGPVTVMPVSEIPLYVYCKPDSIGKFEGDIELTILRGNLKRYLKIELVGYGAPDGYTIITQNIVTENWNALESPYLILDNISIEAGEKLTIEPGIRIEMFSNCNFEIGENAQLIATGTETDSIYFTAFNPERGCNGLSFIDSGDDDKLSFCLFEGMGNEVTNGGALNIHNTDLVIQNSKFYKNLSQTGGAIFAEKSLIEVTYSEFSGNRALKGGAIYNDSSEPIISNNRFTSNKAEIGGAIASKRSSFELNKNIFYNNRSSIYGGVIFSTSSNISIKNCIMDSNLTDKEGSILACNNSEIFIQNITVVNYSFTKFEDLFVLLASNNIEVKNSIFWNGKTNSSSFKKSEPVNPNLTESIQSTIIFHYNNCDSLLLNSTSEKQSKVEVSWGAKNISEDPQFIDFENKNYKLLENSLCVDAGDPRDDIGDEPFPHAFQLNLGAYGGTAATCITPNLRLTVDPYQIDFGEQSSLTDTKEQIIDMFLKNGCLEDINITNMFINDTTYINFIDFPFPNNSFVLKSGEIMDLRIKFDFSLITEGLFDTEIFINSDELTEIIIPILAKIYSSTKLQGAISGVLYKENNPHMVVSDISIEEGKSLLIQPGVKLYFPSNTDFIIEGMAQLQAIGTEKDSIYFMAQDSSNWYGISFRSTGDDDTLQYCVIEDATWALHSSSTSPTIANCLFKNNVSSYSNVSFVNSDRFKVSNCRFEYNNSNRAVLIAFGSNGIVENTIFYENTGTCIDMSGFHDQHQIELINLTLANNRSDNALIYFDNTVTYSDWAVMKNSIIGENLNLLGSIIEVNSAKVTIEYSDIDTTSSNWLRETQWNDFPLGKLIWGEGNISTNPMFVDSENSDFTLLEDSPCIDAGSPNEIYNDIEDPYNSGYALWPAMGTIRNDMGAYGGGAYTITSVKDLKENDEIPTSYSLSQNYPNPFNPSTIIRYSIPSNVKREKSNDVIPSGVEGMTVEIKIYDILGREVTTLVNEEQKPGYYEVSWNAKNLSSGVYIYRIQINNFVNSKKMLLLR